MDLSPLSKVIPSFGSPTLEGFDLNNVQDGQRIKGSNRQYVHFYKKGVPETYAVDVQVNAKTGDTKVLKMGVREVEKEFVKIVTPGDKNEYDGEAQAFHKQEHFLSYKSFRDGNNAPIGTSIEECSFVSPSVALELRYLKVFTIEQLAESSDILCNSVANGFEIREFARAFVTANTAGKGDKQVSILKTELADAQKIISELQTQMKTVISDLKVEPKKKGRPVSINKLVTEPTQSE